MFKQCHFKAIYLQVQEIATIFFHYISENFALIKKLKLFKVGLIQKYKPKQTPTFKELLLINYSFLFLQDQIT